MTKMKINKNQGPKRFYKLVNSYGCQMNGEFTDEELVGLHGAGFKEVEDEND